MEIPLRYSVFFAGSHWKVDSSQGKPASTSLFNLWAYLSPRSRDYHVLQRGASVPDWQLVSCGDRSAAPGPPPAGMQDVLLLASTKPLLLSFPTIWQFKCSYPKKDHNLPSWRSQWHAWIQIAVPDLNTHIFLYKGSCNFATFTKDKEFHIGLLCRHAFVRFSWLCDLCQGLSYNSRFCLKAKHSNSGGYYCHHIPAALLRFNLAKAGLRDIICVCVCLMELPLFFFFHILLSQGLFSKQQFMPPSVISENNQAQFYFWQKSNAKWDLRIINKSDVDKSEGIQRRAT